MMARRAIEPSQLRKRRRRRRIFKIILWLLIFVIIIFGSAYLTHLQAISISDIEISGNDITSKEGITQIVQENTDGRYFYLFSKNNIFLYPRQKIENDILEKYKRIETVSIRQSNLNGISISIKERKPLAIWCRNIEDVSSSCYFLDETGYAFAESNGSDNLYFIYSGLMGERDPVGEKYLPDNRFQVLSSFVDKVKGLGIETSRLSADDDQNFQLHLDLGGRILFTATSSTDQTFANLETVLDKNNPPDTRVDLSRLDYLNLRSGNKVFYKLQGMP